MKTLLTVLLLLVALAARPATIKYYDDYPNNANPPGTYIISIQTLDKSVGGTPYNFWTLNQMVAWLQLRGFTNGSGTVINIITNNILITTNITVEVPGGVTNLNLTPKSVMWSDVNDAEASIPNATGVLTNDGSGGIGFSLSIQLTEIDAQNFYPTNMFLTYTNDLLSTDGNGQPTNAVIGSGLSFSGNVLSAVGTASTPYASNILSGGTLSTNVEGANNGFNGYVLGQSNGVPQWTTNGGALGNLNGAFIQTASVPNAALGNSGITVQGSSVSLGGATLAAGSTPSFSADNITNQSYIVKTNNGGGNALVAGAPGTAMNCYLTNITADTTLAAATFWTAGMSAIPVLVTCSGGADRVLKLPANVIGCGPFDGVDLQGTGITVTNAEGWWLEWRCVYGVKTNLFGQHTK